MTRRLLESLHSVLFVDRDNVALLRNYLHQLGVEVGNEPAPPGYRAAECQYLASSILHREGILSAEAVARYRDPWLKAQADMQQMNGSLDNLRSALGLESEKEIVDRLAEIKAELARLDSKNAIEDPS